MTQPNSTPFGVRPLAWGLVVATLILLFVGGLVTTYRVGMAVPDWPTTSGYGMLSYPLDNLIKDDWGTQLEHGHRLIASAVGLLTLLVLVFASLPSGARVATATLVAIGLQIFGLLNFFGDLRSGTTGEILPPEWGALLPWLGASLAILLGTLFTGRDRGLRLLAVVVNLAVVTQGILGGARVILDSSEYGFIHGTIAQGVFTLMFALLIVSGRRFAGSSRGMGGALTAFILALGTAAAVFSQAQLGAMTRHSGAEKAGKFVMMHFGMAVIVIGLLVALLITLRKLAERTPEDDPARAGIGFLRKMIMGVTAAQVFLGVGTFIVILMVTGGFDKTATTGEAVLASFHVIGGALLLGSCFAAALWAGRLHFGGRAIGGAA